MTVDLDQMFKEPICLSSVSKDTRGDLSAQDRDLQKCEISGRIVASYVINFDPSARGISSAIEGSIEGVVICPCEDSA